MAETPPDGEGPDRRAAERLLRRHVQAFLVVNALLFAGTLLAGAGWWLYWAVLAWSLGLMAHWLFVRAIYVDEAWVEERTLEVRGDAYDLAHIQDIERRHQKRRAGRKEPAKPAGGRK